MLETPPFQLTPKAVSLIAEISEHLGRYALCFPQTDSLKLRRENRIRTICSSLSIEGNSLSQEQITAVLSGKTVVGPLRDIQEVRNAIAAYDIAGTLNPFSLKDLLKAHGIMMSALLDRPGCFRRGVVGVFSQGKQMHVARLRNGSPT